MCLIRHDKAFAEKVSPRPEITIKTQASLVRGLFHRPVLNSLRIRKSGGQEKGKATDQDSLGGI
jgi:hypothetical protein